MLGLKMLFLPIISKGYYRIKEIRQNQGRSGNSKADQGNSGKTPVSQWNSGKIGKNNLMGQIYFLRKLKQILLGMIFLLFLIFKNLTLKFLKCPYLMELFRQTFQPSIF